MANSLKDELAAALPDGFQCKVRYIHTPPKSCEPLFSPPPASEPEKTRLASNFITISITPNHESTSGVFVLGIEVLVYKTKHLTTLFVSKADSTGYLPHQRPSPAKAIATAFLKWLTAHEKQTHPHRKLVVSLFARSQSQYLFPASAENSGKHVLDDRQLIKWWARVFDPIISGDQAQGVEWNGYITVPGYEGVELRQFFPPMNASSGATKAWHAGNPLPELAETRRIPANSPPRCLLPRFPDDPKARFMQDLDNEVGLSENSTTISPSKRKGGNWNNVRDLDRFWESMEFRQECSSGRVVGFLWLVNKVEESFLPDTQAQSQGESLESLLAAPTSDPTSTQDKTNGPSKSSARQRRKPLSGPIIPRQPRLKGGSSSLTATSDLADMVNAEPRDGLLLTKEGYDQAMQTLLRLDFATLEAATQSTSKWISAVSTTNGTQTDWSLDIIGNVKIAPSAPTVVGNGNLQVNDLGGMVRKKRKNDDEVAARDLSAGAQHEPAVNILAGGMVRKKAKPARAPS